MVSVNESDPLIKGLENKEDFGMIRMNRKDLNSAEYTNLDGKDGNLTKQLLAKHSVEFTKAYQATERVWKEVNE